MDRSKLLDGVSFDPKFAATLDDWNLDWGVLGDEEVTIIPPMATEPFEVDEDYVLKISKGSVVDLSGNPMSSDYKIQFQTLKYPVEKNLNPTITSGCLLLGNRAGRGSSCGVGHNRQDHQQETVPVVR